MTLRIESIHFSYGSQPVLGDISFEAEQNQIIAVLGANGAGKTTLLKCLCNILRPQRGRIMLGKKDVLGLSGRELAKLIGYVPQSVPPSRMTVFDGVLIGRKPHIELAVSKTDVAITSSVIDLMGLAPLALRYLNQISGGEFQKVQIARAIAQESQVLILDEPSNNLDIANQHKTMHLVESVVRSRGVCTIMTMHDINLAIHYSDRFIFLCDGQVAACGGLEVITEELIEKVYGIESEIVDHRGVPFVVPSNSSKYHHAKNHDHPHDVHDHLLHPQESDSGVDH